MVVISNETFNCSTTLDDHTYYRRLSEITVSIAVLILSSLGLFGNVLILILFQRIDRLNALPNRPIIQTMAFLNVLQSISYDTLTAYFMAINKDDGIEFYKPTLSLCKFRLTIAGLIFPGGQWCLLGLTLARYFHCRGYSWYFRHRQRVIRGMIVWSLFVGFLIGVPGNWDILRIRYDQRLYECLWDPADGQAVQSVVYGFALGVPIVLTAWFTFVLLPLRRRPTPMTVEQSNTIKALIAIYLTTCLFQLPFIVMICIPHLKLPSPTYPWTMLLASSRNFVNVYAYVRYCKSYQMAVVMLIKCKRIASINTALTPRCKFRYVANGALSKSNNDN